MKCTLVMKNRHMSHIPENNLENMTLLVIVQVSTLFNFINFLSQIWIWDIGKWVWTLLYVVEVAWTWCLLDRTCTGYWCFWFIPISFFALCTCPRVITVHTMSSTFWKVKDSGVSTCKQCVPLISSFNYRLL